MHFVAKKTGGGSNGATQVNSSFIRAKLWLHKIKNF